MVTAGIRRVTGFEFHLSKGCCIVIREARKSDLEMVAKSLSKTESKKTKLRSGNDLEIIGSQGLLFLRHRALSKFEKNWQANRRRVFTTSTQPLKRRTKSNYRVILNYNIKN